MNKSRKLRASVGKNTTRKNTRRIIVLQPNYVLEDGEKEVPLNTYTPKLLPVPVHICKNNQISSSENTKAFFTLAQTDTDDKFVVSVKYGYKRFEILVGGKELHGCVIITIQQVDWNDPNSLMEAYINLKYNKNCNITHDLTHGTGTVILLRTAISFALTYFKIDKFRLKDKSVFQCDRKHNISLPALYILKHGQSWYKKHIGARIYNAKLQANIQRYKEFVATKPDWEYLYQSYILPDLRNEDNHCSTEDIRRTTSLLHEAWARTDTYKDFILEIVSNKTRCSFLMNWFNNIFFDIVDEELYGEADNFIMYSDFPFVQGLQVGFVEAVCKDEDTIGVYRCKMAYTKNEHSMMGGGSPDGHVEITYDPIGMF
jgi:hypothetical protein